MDQWVTFQLTGKVFDRVPLTKLESLFDSDDEVKHGFRAALQLDVLPFKTII